MKDDAKPARETFIPRPFFNGQIIDKNIVDGLAILVGGMRHLYDTINDDKDDEQEEMEQEFLNNSSAFIDFLKGYNDQISALIADGVSIENNQQLNNYCVGFREIGMSIRESIRKADVKA